MPNSRQTPGRGSMASDFIRRLHSTRHRWGHTANSSTEGPSRIRRLSQRLSTWSRRRRAPNRQISPYPERASADPFPLAIPRSPSASYVTLFDHSSPTAKGGEDSQDEKETSFHHATVLPYISSNPSMIDMPLSETGSDYRTTCPPVLYNCLTHEAHLVWAGSVNKIVGKLPPTPSVHKFRYQIGEFQNLCQDWATKGEVERNGEHLSGNDAMEELETIRRNICLSAEAFAPTAEKRPSLSAAEARANAEKRALLDADLGSVIKFTRGCISNTDTPATLKKTIFDTMARKIYQHYRPDDDAYSDEGIVGDAAFSYRKAIEFVRDGRKLNGLPFEVGPKDGDVESRRVFCGLKASTFAAASCYRFQSLLDEDHNSDPDHTRRREELSKMAQIVHEITDHQYTQASCGTDPKGYKKGSGERTILMPERDYRRMIGSYQSALRAYQTSGDEGDSSLEIGE